MIKLFKFLFFFATTTFIYAVSPASQKIETILPLTNTCFVVVINNQAEIIAEINRLSNNELQTMVDRWESSMPAGNPPDWHAYKARAKIRNKYLHQARENLKERDFAQKGFYSLKSKGKTSPSVLEVNITYVGVDASDLPGDHQFKYGIYAYLELDSPMKNGQTYTIYAPNKLERTFNYNEKMQISRAIKVNQVGYLPNQAGKFAYLGAYIYGKGPLDCSKAKKFHIIDESTGKSVYEGEISIREKDPRWHNENAKRINGEDIYQMNLDDFNESGHFHIYIPGVGRSWSFIQSAEVYGEAYYIAARGFYHQRAVMEYQEPYTFWKRDLAHTEDVYECDLIPFGFGAKFDAPKTSNLRFDVIGGSISSRFPLKEEETSILDELEEDGAKGTPNVDGGWYDAADWDRNIHHYTPIFAMLYAYELAPKKFIDGQLNIPESNNGIPDILDEAMYGLRVWEHSLTEEGGAAGFLETWTHPEMHAKVDYAFSVRTRWASLAYSAAAAQLAYLLKDIAPKISQKYQNQALLTYQYGSNPENSLGEFTMRAKKRRGAGDAYQVKWTEKDEMNYPYLIHAKLRLFLLTKDIAYLEDVEKLSTKVIKPYDWPSRPAQATQWFYFHLTQISEISEITRVAWQNYFTEYADMLVENSNKMPYRQSWWRNKDFHMGWGTTTMTNFNQALFIANVISPKAKYMRAFIQNCDYMLGCNPLGMSWTTGIGSQYPVIIQHEISEKDDILDPIPGITPYGLTGNWTQHKFRESVWLLTKNKNSPIPFYNPDELPINRRWMSHPSINTAQCEFTVHETMPATLFSYAMLAPNDWKPIEEVLKSKPKTRKMLYGYWFLP